MPSLLDCTNRAGHHFCTYNLIKEKMVAEKAVSEPLRVGRRLPKPFSNSQLLDYEPTQSVVHLGTLIRLSS